MFGSNLGWIGQTKYLSWGHLSKQTNFSRHLVILLHTANYHISDIQGNCVDFFQFENIYESPCINKSWRGYAGVMGYSNPITMHIISSLSATMLLLHTR